MAETLFRFMLVRAPLAPDPAKPSVKLSQDSQLQTALQNAAKEKVPREALDRAVNGYINDDKQFLKSEDSTPLQKKLLRFSGVLSKAEQSGALNLETVNHACEQELGSPPTQLVESQEFNDLIKGLKDTLVAQKFAQKGPIAALSAQLRDCELLVLAARQAPDGDRQLSETSNGSAGVLRDETPTPPIPPAWALATVYSLGSLVTFEGRVYVCIQAHTSAQGWQPTLTPALWVRAPLGGNNPLPQPQVPLPDPTTDGTISAFRQRHLEMPFQFTLPSILAPSPEKPADGAENPKPPTMEQVAKKLLDDHDKLTAAVEELLKLGPADFDVAEKKLHPQIVVAPELHEMTLKADQLKFHKSLAEANLDLLKPGAVEGPQLTTIEGGTAAATASPVVNLAQSLLVLPGGVAPRAAFDPAVMVAASLRVKPSTSLTPGTASTLKQHGIVIESASLPNIVADLRQHIASRVDSLRAIAPTLEHSSISRIGMSIVEVKTPSNSRLTDFFYGGHRWQIGDILPIIPEIGRVPRTKGKFEPVGVADLLVVKQQLKGYEAADVAHIENVLKGESKLRDYTDVRRTESTTFTESELTNAEEHELGSAQRFEMSKESETTIKEDASLKAGLKATARYGMVLEVSASAEGALSRSRGEINREASRYSQDITQRAVKKITDRVLQRQSFTTGTEVTEKNSHGIDNKGGAANVAGVYQWVNKVYEAQVFNYGLRTIYDFMVPEPAAFLMSAMTRSAESAGADLVKPMPLTITAANVTRSSYQELALKYGATDVVPPPEDFVTRSDQVAKTKGDKGTDHTHSGVIQIPQGYEAVQAAVSFVRNQWSDDAVIDVFVGADTNRIGKDESWVWTARLESQKGEIAWGFDAFRISSCVVAVQVTCKATARAFEAWQLETHAKLYNAWKAREMEYNEKLERLKLQQGVVIEGRNPTANLATIRGELKKSCIEIMTGQHFELFNSITTPVNELPRINLAEAEAEGEYVRFFEQAFEWDQMSYVTYPYFWGSRQRWEHRLAFDDPDPTFDDFLKAGFARVVVPARPDFANAVDHFRRFGELWRGGPLPVISDPLYVAIADEVSERAQRPGAEIPQGEPWELRVPTTLVKLRRDDGLPRWEKGANGLWLPVTEA